MLAKYTANASLIARRTTTHYIAFTPCYRLTFIADLAAKRAIIFSQAPALTAQGPQALVSA
jgi:hypothetical protein